MPSKISVNSPQVFSQLWCANVLFKLVKGFSDVELVTIGFIAFRIIAAGPRRRAVFVVGFVSFQEIAKKKPSRGWNQTHEYNDQNDLSLFEIRSFKWNLGRNRSRKAQSWTSQLHSQDRVRAINLGIAQELHK